MTRTSTALRFAALGLFAAALIAIAISSDMFGTLTLGAAKSARPLVLADGRDISEPTTTAEPPAEVEVARARPPFRQNRLARAKRALPLPPLPVDTSPPPMPPPPPVPTFGVTALVSP